MFENEKKILLKKFEIDELLRDENISCSAHNDKTNTRQNKMTETKVHFLNAHFDFIGLSVR